MKISNAGRTPRDILRRLFVENGWSQVDADLATEMCDMLGSGGPMGWEITLEGPLSKRAQQLLEAEGPGEMVLVPRSFAAVVFQSYWVSLVNSGQDPEKTEDFIALRRVMES